MSEAPTTAPTGSQALTVYDGAGIDRMRSWTRMARGERRRRAMEAAAQHDAATLLGLADAYLTLRGQQGDAVSDTTRAKYRHGIQALLTAWAHEDLLQPGENAANAWVRELQHAGRQPSTIKGCLVAGRLLYQALRWARAVDADVDPFARVGVRDATPAWEKRAAYSDDDVAAILGVIDKRDHDERAGPAALLMARYDRVLVLLGAHAGLRASEMVDLRWRHVHLGTRELVVEKGKGGKRRTVVMSSSLARALAAIPPEQRGAYVLPYRARQSAWYRLAQLTKRAGIDEELRGLHRLRHTAGTRLMNETHDLVQVAAQLGHAQLDTSRAYAKRDRSATKTVMEDW